MAYSISFEGETVAQLTPDFHHARVVTLILFPVTASVARQSSGKMLLADCGEHFQLVTACLNPTLFE